jgi:hypothetical protein
LFDTGAASHRNIWKNKGNAVGKKKILPGTWMANSIPYTLCRTSNYVHLKNSWNLQLIWVVTYCVVSDPIIPDITMYMVMILNNGTLLQWQLSLQVKSNTDFSFYISVVLFNSVIELFTLLLISSITQGSGSHSKELLMY